MKSLKKDKKNRTQRPAAVRRSKNGGEESSGVFGAWKVGNGGERWEVGVQKFFLSYSQIARQAEVWGYGVEGTTSGGPGSRGSGSRGSLSRSGHNTVRCGGGRRRRGLMVGADRARRQGSLGCADLARGGRRRGLGVGRPRARRWGRPGLRGSSSWGVV
ncbi:hypothetical protein TIFTF001_001980 [Ficus carica]|uniref:Uncharacterized protein n=1 Tax=Ficus carica TaxID=3494 RepID=A0AA87Z9H4_FICCA|nr:hypothetical protein TIFTF001_001980 [Ficus carica]